MSLPSDESPEEFGMLEFLVRSEGTDWVRRALAEIEDMAKERSCSDDRPTPAWNE